MYDFRDGNVENNALFSAAGGVLYPPGMILSLAAAAQEQGINDLLDLNALLISQYASFS